MKRPFYKPFTGFIFKMLVPFFRIYKGMAWKKYLDQQDEIKILIGAGQTDYQGWFSTDKHTLDITSEEDFKKYFTVKKIRNILAEHVFEHLGHADIKNAVSNFFKYSDEDVNVRIAVPDGWHTDADYIDDVKPGGKSQHSHEHTQLFTLNSLSSYFEKVGFKSHPVEYWTKDGEFVSNYEDDENGYILRSLKNDHRNIDGAPNYTSLIIDFRKK